MLTSTGDKMLLGKLIKAAEQMGDKVLKVETLPRNSEDPYDIRHIVFFESGSVEIVNYKGEGEDYFSTVEDFYHEYPNAYIQC